MYCKKCGNQIEEGAAFCKKCGAPVEKTFATNMTGTARQKGNMQADARYIRTGIVASSLLMALATFLPYLKMNKEMARYSGIRSINLVHPAGQFGDGVIFIILAALMLVFLYLKKNLPVLVCGIIPFLMYCYELAQIKRQDAQLLGSRINMYDYMSKGSGFYLLSVSVIALLALSVLFFIQGRNAGERNG